MSDVKIDYRRALWEIWEVQEGSLTSALGNVRRMAREEARAGDADKGDALNAIGWYWGRAQVAAEVIGLIWEKTDGELGRAHSEVDGHLEDTSEVVTEIRRTGDRA